MHPKLPHIAVSMKTVLRYAYTMHLFTRSDLKTIFFPIVLFAFASVPNTTPARLMHASFWVWLHLLQFCVSNQSLSPDEDRLNKPWRPIPSGRFSVSQTKMLRWLLLPACLTLSMIHDISSIGTIFAIGVILHNECLLDSHWFTRNALNALGYAVFDAGATCIACSDDSGAFSPRVVSAQYMSVLIVLTTIHAQDFRDEAGDRLQKRHTIPIVMPHIGRVSMPLFLVAWSFVLCAVCRLSWCQFAVLLALAILTGGRFYLIRTAKADRLSYTIYNIWLALARIAPLYGSPIFS
ncbi:uncharacterized protein LAESUDRAFT_684635 [Laetiporus sulphureus 93-53]|uniref:UbiA prenyltransferase n=1 Tax=Laetiporus sulphureus 93-53 TaxID=1314785 RepID=A0A165CH30_9APHY|nr:uncharacterized protein LAESUDRAFT_684635 [Laetiporus sulphureus 93-53]KZT02795.1 hypothetical protein LAESUDRAFT_684635 [Laetiporus sulphureus 93-53]